MNIKRFSILLSSALALGALSTVASDALAEGTDTDDLDVTATVIDNCTITAGTVAFGDYDPAIDNKAANLDGTGTVSVICTTGASAKVTLGQGVSADTGSTDAAPLRRMVYDTDNFLSYSLFQEAGRTTVWGNTDATGVVATADGASHDLTVYGRVAMDQNVPAGAYNDTVVATVTF
jgi:spore coat protein U-like protein